MEIQRAGVHKGRRMEGREPVWGNGLWLQGLPLFCLSQGQGTVPPPPPHYLILFLGQIGPLIQREATFPRSPPAADTHSLV